MSRYRFVVGLCEIIPGFTVLHNKDKATLMEAAYFELWLVTSLFSSLLSLIQFHLCIYRSTQTSQL